MDLYHLLSVAVGSTCLLQTYYMKRARVTANLTLEL